VNALDKNAVEKPNFTSLSGYASAKDISIAVMYAVFTKKIMLSPDIFFTIIWIVIQKYNE